MIGRKHFKDAPTLLIKFSNLITKTIFYKLLYSYQIRNGIFIEFNQEKFYNCFRSPNNNFLFFSLLNLSMSRPIAIPRKKPSTIGYVSDDIKNYNKNCHSKTKNNFLQTKYEIWFDYNFNNREKKSSKGWL